MCVFLTYQKKQKKKNDIVSVGMSIMSVVAQLPKSQWLHSRGASTMFAKVSSWFARGRATVDAINAAKREARAQLYRNTAVPLCVQVRLCVGQAKISKCIFILSRGTSKYIILCLGGLSTTVNKNRKTKQIQKRKNCNNDDNDKKEK